MQNSQKALATVLAILIIGVIIAALFQSSSTATIQTETATTTTANSSSVSTEVNKPIVDVKKDDIVDLNIPDYISPIQFSTNIQADVKLALQNAAANLKDKIAADPFDLKSWINLGTVRKIGEDYTGAEKAWIFVTQAAPTDSIAYSNLGDLYDNFLKNYPKAEQAYLTAIKLSPTIESSYINLHVMYANKYKQSTNAAEEILKKGLLTLPESIPLHIELARFYKTKGDTARAKEQYDLAIALANKSNQTSLAAQIQTEMNQ
jgi:tetratricopeptide (TPR) repeat protein